MNDSLPLTHFFVQEMRPDTDAPLTPYETALLQAWINEGTPNGGGGP